MKADPGAPKCRTLFAVHMVPALTHCSGMAAPGWRFTLSWRHGGCEGARARPCHGGQGAGQPLVGTASDCTQLILRAARREFLPAPNPKAFYSFLGRKKEDGASVVPAGPGSPAEKQAQGRHLSSSLHSVPRSTR